MPRKVVHLEIGKEELERLSKEAALHGCPSISDYFLMLSRRERRRERREDVAESLQGKEARRVFATTLGEAFLGDSRRLLAGLRRNSVDLVMTSPPFGLVFKKDYGNEDADRYVQWFEPFAKEIKRILKPNGSLVIDIGGAWKRGQPTRSLYHYELLISLCRTFGFFLAQEFYWWNPAKLPSPAEWVNVRRVRVKDAVNCIWWLSPTPYPKASNTRVLQPYSESMRILLRNGYKPGLRPSGHRITGKFSRDNGGAIPPNLIAVANTESQSAYREYCRKHDLPEHPARFPAAVPAFFVRMLTNKRDLVVDPFAGSCMTGAVAEELGRRWICCELEESYVRGARGRFLKGVSHMPAISEQERPYQLSSPRPWRAERPGRLAPEGGRTK